MENTKAKMLEAAEEIKNPADKARYIEIIKQVEVSPKGTYVSPDLANEIDAIRKRNR